jgi:CheY-like chemotaxis protein
LALAAYDAGNLFAELPAPKLIARMTLSALLVCVKKDDSEVLQQVLAELGIHVESCPDVSRAAIRAEQRRYDLIAVDGESNSEVVQFLQDTQKSRANDATVVVVVVSSQDNAHELFSLGVNFVLYKPVVYECAASSLSAAYALMTMEKRRDPRAPVHAHAQIDYANVERQDATLVNLSKGGMAVQFGKTIPPTSKVYFQFQLPGQSACVRLSGQLAWQDWTGRGGVQFADVPKTSRRLLAEFLAANSQPHNGRQFPESTVEMEQPVHVTTLEPGKPGEQGKFSSTEEDLHEDHGPAHTYEFTSPEAAAMADSSNRRTHTRYACRVSAEVYRTGSTVPNHCSLTDLSAGGCYLEVSLPFPQGASVEIVVRTHDLKLHLRGVVQASHPGYGMGIAFELNTRDEIENVKKLTEFVAATATSAN